jgi:hypothetical protein
MDSGIVWRITFDSRGGSKLVFRWNFLLYVERRTRRTPALATYRFQLHSISGESLSEHDVLFILTLVTQLRPPDVEMKPVCILEL